MILFEYVAFTHTTLGRTMNDKTRCIAGEDLREALEDSESYDRIICIIEAIDDKTRTRYNEILHSHLWYSCVASEWDEGYYRKSTWKFYTDKETESANKIMPNVILLFIGPDYFNPANRATPSHI